MKARIITVISILLNIIAVLCMPLYNIKFFHEVGVFTGVDENGNFITCRRDFYYSPFKNLSALDSSWLMYVNVAILAAGIVITVISLIKRNYLLKKASLSFSACSVILFVFSMFLASTVYRAY